MSTHRRQVFIDKVRKRLFPSVPSSPEKETPQSLALETPPKNITSETVQQKDDVDALHHLTDGDIKIKPKCQLYTVSLPPEGYVSCLPEPNNCTNSEDASSGDDAEDLNLPDQQKRRRSRKHKSKKKLKNPNDVIIEQEESKKQQNLLQGKDTSGPTVSKNKKKKLKKKQQLRRKKAAGLVTKASGVSFTYQPEEGSSEQEDVEHAAKEGAQDPLEVGPGDPSEGGTVPDIIQKDNELADSKVDGNLNFLKATQEIDHDGISKDSDSSVYIETAEALLCSLESRRMPPSDILTLDHRKAQLYLKDMERLKNILERFQECFTLSPDHARVFSDFFNYWATHILPLKSSIIT
uniref:glutamate-rich protein 1 isoform X1 n=1 Tax=Jaculus jaculus TaxID=51337 RepID=UPI001E1AFA3D|nr:glutamate-rich protein 1 isoform X1 [Jaculus jaculus]